MSLKDNLAAVRDDKALADGRMTVDERKHIGHDLLLEQLRAVYGEPRAPSVAPVAPRK